jgi:hypothetical protein
LSLIGHGLSLRRFGLSLLRIGVFIRSLLTCRISRRCGLLRLRLGLQASLTLSRGFLLLLRQTFLSGASSSDCARVLSHLRGLARFGHDHVGILPARLHLLRFD